MFCSEIVIRCRKCVVRSELAFAAEWRVLQRFCDSLSKLSFCSELTFAVDWVFSSEIMIHYWNCVVHSELTFAAESCVRQLNCDSLSKLCRLQRIGIRYRMAYSAVNLWFAAELGVQQQNCDSLPKLCRLRRINIRCWNWVVCSKPVFAAELATCNEPVFATALGTCNEPALLPNWQPAANRFPAELAARSEPVFVAELVACRKPASLPNWQPAANQFSLPISIIGLLRWNDLNASNNFMLWWCKMWDTWMWTYELLK